MRKPQLVIFDCDGVLVDSEIISNSVLARSLNCEGLGATLEEARRDYHGLLMADVVSQAQRKLGRPLPEGWLQRFEGERTAALRRELQAVPGAAEALRHAGVAVCVASQGKIEKTQLSLALTGLRGLFAEKALFSAREVLRGAPQPDLFLHAARVMGVAPARCTVVEDSARRCHRRRIRPDARPRVRRREQRGRPAACRAEMLPSLAKLPVLLGLDSVQAETGRRRDPGRR